MTIRRFSTPKKLGALCLLLALPLFNLAAADIQNPPPAGTQPQDSSGSNESLRAYLQLQEQIHDTQLAIDRNRQDAQAAQAAATQNAITLSNHLQSIEASLLVQRRDELADAQHTNQLLLLFVSLFAVVGFGAAVFTAYFQWRALSRLAEISAALPAVRGMPGLQPVPALGLGEHEVFANGAAEQSNLRLIGLVETLEKRIAELEHTSAPPLKGLPNGNGNGQSATVQNGTDPIPDEKAAQLAPLLEQAQSLMNSDRLEEAIACFDQILTLAPDHAETLVKKGAALEKLRQPQQALECYDRAIDADHSMTIAYLHKGGLCNRLERYTEAMECYERALHTQEKKRVA
jgi:tetratricopeptide (TPR) repeat protein